MCIKHAIAFLVNRAKKCVCVKNKVYHDFILIISIQIQEHRDFT